ncbi:hypothetical protein D918_00726 [Trichuris suis]|nr:hypothetical protein D918_00726 [Trichuris suis]
MSKLHSHLSTTSNEFVEVFRGESYAPVTITQMIQTEVRCPDRDVEEENAVNKTSLGVSHKFAVTLTSFDFGRKTMALRKRSFLQLAKEMLCGLTVPKRVTKIHGEKESVRPANQSCSHVQQLLDSKPSFISNITLLWLSEAVIEHDALVAP